MYLYSTGFKMVLVPLNNFVSEITSLIYYRSHGDGEGNAFTGVCPLTRG